MRKDDLTIRAEGVALPATCSPSGPELCFDAIDNNCNGIIDEGCGVGTGPLQFAIAWPEGSDVDLRVTYRRTDEPVTAPHGLAELVKDRECGRPQNNCHGQNLENVYYTGERPLGGVYKVEIKLDNAEQVRGSVPVQFGARLGAKTLSLPLELDASAPSKEFTFRVEPG